MFRAITAEDFPIWLVVSTPLKNMKDSWGDHSQFMESHTIHVPNHQRAIYVPMVNCESTSKNTSGHSPVFAPTLHGQTTEEQAEETAPPWGNTPPTEMHY